VPKLLYARAPQGTDEERKIRKLAGSRHAPADWIKRARMIILSWEGLRTAMIAAKLRCHPQTVRERIPIASTPRGWTGSAIVPALAGSLASQSWNARRSSLSPEQSRPGAWCAAVVESLKPSMRKGRPTGRLMH
jgi:hypothetical protein